jgi:hypothetical protein
MKPPTEPRPAIAIADDALSARMVELHRAFLSWLVMREVADAGAESLVLEALGVSMAAVTRVRELESENVQLRALVALQPPPTQDRLQ